MDNSFASHIYQDITSYLKHQQSLIITGVPASGQTTLLQTLTQNQDLQNTYLPHQNIIYLDLNHTPNPTTFFLTLHHTLSPQDTSTLNSDLNPITTQLIQLTQDAPTTIILDHFHITLNFSPEFFNQLSAWRQQLRHQLTYLASIDHLREYAAKQTMHSLQTTFKHNHYHIPMYKPSDIQQLTLHSHTTLTQDQIVKISNQSSGHPGLAKVLADWAMQNPLEFNHASPQQILKHPNITFMLEYILKNLTPTERTTLSHPSSNDEATTYLQSIHLLNPQRQPIIKLLDQYLQNTTPTQSTLQITKGNVFKNDKITEHLSNNEYKILNYLFQHQNSIITRDQLAKILSPESSGQGVSNETIDQHISRIRKKLSEPSNSQLLQTIHGRGYMLNNTK